MIVLFFSFAVVVALPAASKKSGTKTKKIRVPRGMSEYQAAWLLSNAVSVSASVFIELIFVSAASKSVWGYLHDGFASNVDRSCGLLLLIAEASQLLCRGEHTVWCRSLDCNASEERLDPLNFTRTGRWLLFVWCQRSKDSSAFDKIHASIQQYVCEKKYEVLNVADMIGYHPCPTRRLPLCDVFLSRVTLILLWSCQSPVELTY